MGGGEQEGGELGNERKTVHEEFGQWKLETNRQGRKVGQVSYKITALRICLVYKNIKTVVISITYMYLRQFEVVFLFDIY